MIDQEKGREDDWFRKNEKELIEAARATRKTFLGRLLKLKQ